MIEDALVNVTDEDVMVWSVNGEHNDETILQKCIYSSKLKFCKLVTYKDWWT